MNMPPPSVLNNPKVEGIRLLYLSSSVRGVDYGEKLQVHAKRKPKVEVINHKKLVDFDKLRKTLLDAIGSMPERLKVGNSKLSEYLNIHGLNMWWTSGIVEATPYKRNLIHNLYYLSAVSQVLKKFRIDLVYFQTENVSFKNDLITMLKNEGIRYYRAIGLDLISYLKKQKNSFTFLIYFIMHFLYSCIFKVWIKPKEINISKRSMHIFYSSYPSEIVFKSDTPVAKIYKDLPTVVSKELGGEVYHLCYLSIGEFSFFKLIKNIRQSRRHNFKLIPLNAFVSTWDMVRIIFSPIRYWKYYKLKRSSEYRTIFKISDINAFYTFDKIMRDSLTGNEARINLLHYYAFRNVVRSYGKNISEIIYNLEFHNWEIALISGVKSVDSSISVIGLQQSAANPILLNFFFSPLMFKNEDDSYPLPDLTLCSGEVYKNLLVSGGIKPELIKVIGHFVGQYLNASPLSKGSKQKKRNKLDLPVNKKICLIACSIDLPMTEAIVYILRDVVTKLPETLFLFKSHPNSPAEPLLRKYGMNELDNVELVRHSIANTLPVVDYFLSTSTSVSQEALRLGIPQVNLDVAALPKANPLHLIPNLIADVETSDALLDFFHNTEKFKISKEKAFLFMGDPAVEPCRKVLDIITANQKSNEYENLKVKGK